MDTSFIEEKREVTFDWHMGRVLKWLECDNGQELDGILVYASVELRCAIERYLFELLVLLRKPDDLTADEAKKCKSKNGVLAVMKKTEPYYRKRAKFANLVASVAPGIPRVVIIDINYLIRMWSELSLYCHKQLSPRESWNSLNREFQERGFRIINEIIDRFRTWEHRRVFGSINKQSMPSETRSVYEKYISEEIDENQAKRMLDLMQPVLRAKQRGRKLGWQ